MNKIKNKLGKTRVLLAALAVALLGSCSDDWDDHYSSTVNGNSSESDKTLWEEISSRSELADFAKHLKEAGYDEILNAYQMYTVWAPEGEIDTEGFTADDLEKEIVKNHVARYAYSASPVLNTESQNILMLNNKIMTFAGGTGYTLNNISLVTKNIVTKNGILHIISKPAPYFNNLWEYMNRGSELDSIKKFMYSYTEEEFDEKNSVEAGVVDGMTVYADSVMIVSNILWNRLGYLAKEDSSYLFIAPTNKAWTEAYNRISQYFVYDSKEAKRDSLQDYYTKYSIVRDLIFTCSPTVMLAPKDSLVSTSRDVFHNPQDYIFADFPNFSTGESAVECSNGFIYVTDSLRHKASDSWQKKIKVECENTNLRSNYTGCNIYSRDVPSGRYSGRISNNQYVELVPSSSAVNPTVTYDIPNTLSAAYDVYCVFVPAYVANANTKTAKPSIVRFQLSYHKENGASTIETKVDTVFKNSLTKIDTIMVAENFKFPVANYGQETTDVTLKIMTNVNRNQTTTYTRQLLIDCIYLKPHE